ncbi:methionine--tRNA ligase [Gammaproteobacteria bacterium]|nr:methionine--tRNA ligase [Gammaproteobacteria bacterium]
MSQKKHLITTALFYANGPLHLGHILEMVQADIYARNLRRLGHDVTFFSGDDQHGTPIMLQAEKQGITPQSMIEKVYQLHCADIQDFHISYDHYHGTDHESTRSVLYGIYEKIKPFCIEKDIVQAYDDKKQMFLPDRYVKGKCPKCQAPEQYGDNCEACGATYAISDLIEPYSILTNEAPSQKSSKHLFFDLAQLKEVISDWQNQAKMPVNVKNKLREWLDDLKPWDVTRDEPYFGFEIPDRPSQYFYVWLDAPIGYLGILGDYLQADPLHMWNDENTCITHFIGKDIINFHGLFWPAVLHGAGCRQPDALCVHGFVKIDGQKMSKSRGTFITARQFLEQIPAEYLRYYFASKLTAATDDLDLSLQDFKNKVNGELIGKIINLGNRLMGILVKHFDGQLLDIDSKDALWVSGISHQASIQDHWLSGNYQAAMRGIIGWVNEANQYVDQMAPWKMVKDERSKESAQHVCSLGFNVFFQVMNQLSAVLPLTHQKLIEALSIDGTGELRAQRVKNYPRLLERLTDQQIAALVSNEVTN